MIKLCHGTSRLTAVSNFIFLYFLWPRYNLGVSNELDVIRPKETKLFKFQNSREDDMREPRETRYGLVGLNMGKTQEVCRNGKSHDKNLYVFEPTRGDTLYYCLIIRL